VLRPTMQLLSSIYGDIASEYMLYPIIYMHDIPWRPFNPD